MLTTVEAEINVDGSVRMLEPIRVEKKSRAILTLLDNTDGKGRPLTKEEERLAEDQFAMWIGSVDSGNPRSADNEQIDIDLVKEYGAGLDDE